MGQGIESQLVEALAIGTRDLQRHRDGCPAFARSRAPWCRRRSATPGRRRSATPGRRRSAAPGRGATPSLSAKSRYVRLQRAASLGRQQAARRHALATRMRPEAMGLRRHATGAPCHCGPVFAIGRTLPLALCPSQRLGPGRSAPEIPALRPQGGTPPSRVSAEHVHPGLNTSTSPTPNGRSPTRPLQLGDKGVLVPRKRRCTLDVGSRCERPRWSPARPSDRVSRGHLGVLRQARRPSPRGPRGSHRGLNPDLIVSPIAEHR
jgi:hypothetical protein